MKVRAVFIIAALAAALIACSSPEASRVRGQAGADVGNWRGEVRLHSGPNVYYRTPTEGRGIGHASLIGGALSG